VPKARAIGAEQRSPEGMRTPLGGKNAVPASYFDVDGTLVKTNLVHPTLYYLRNQATPLKTLRRLGTALIKAPAMAMAEMRDRRLFNELLYSAYQGVSEDRMEILGEEVFEDVLKPNLYPFAQDLIAQSKRAGQRVVLISGALDCVLRHLADYLGADDVIANHLEMKDRVATGKMIQPIVAGPTKAKLIREHARAHGFDLDDCYGYTDSYSDVPMLSVVGHPAAVNPDKRLALLAKAYDWPVFRLEH
jgi:HAD superfamily hydrolase (TIGR01490 family)